ncbi:hypothetical protein ACQUW5_02515 [Legionella sp. CNM-1927-20]|uniref:hypothetical protein n=1 Tax=Legionella sp. CNM-1927-20 TaxID=3422221 RepID=UPI00403A8D6D
MDHLQQEQYQDHFSHRPWYKRVKQRFIEFFHNRRDNISKACATVKNCSCAAIQKIVDRPLPYLIMASALGFFLSSILRHK